MKYLCRFDWFHNKFVTEPDDPNYDGPAETMDIIGRGWHVEAENEIDAIVEAEKTKTTWEKGRDTWPEIYDNEYKGDKPIELTNGELLIKRYGKYNPNLTFIISDKEIFWSKDVDPKLNINFDGDAEFIPGEFWVSKKGTKCFRPKLNGSHILIRINWGGCFERSRGFEFDQVSPMAIFARRASSNGGGTGYNFYVFPKNFHREVSIDEI